jgi:glutamine synthetase
VFAAGNRASASNVSVDGANTQIANYNQTTNIQSASTIKELKLQTASANAEFGNGSNAVNVITKGGTNEQHDPAERWLPAEVGRHALGGMLKHLNALTAIGSSTVNSYRRLNDTGMWAPVGASWGLQNRSCAIRVSSPDRFEFRAADSMVNPYLMQGALLKSIDDGLNNKIDPGEPEERNFAEVMASGEKIDRIPNTLEKALDALAENEVVKAALPGELYTIYDWYKRDEWNKFIWQVSNWDVDTYLDCLP